ncbi:hypothetical protein MDA_GLEAN10007346 [Myotis davidii]|uniref:Uncharacterized protein n=1 Tax=Myotis davidii TaxID=225400 RepID=L5LTV9_MYODS|nr:hypothetical protein MDA_GLEAN10007346 [Myotis davidii]
MVPQPGLRRLGRNRLSDISQGVLDCKRARARPRDSIGARIDLYVGGFGTCLHRARLPANNLMEDGKKDSQIPYSKETESTHQQCPNTTKNV